ncbi:GvpL/GvpF family gas vesicle protein [Actinoallomurus sp. NBC_01490]|uniref:GvpL/GvpF family gas vesicle protein n=1 Tax=Actinoallomurus sp. NBC_01490 TaxID=2903557 RepID=UPI002E3400F3|nr:GvpL/GvpF family gas vesicle protein [Actinoallomurus sp. NBC_01490]
MTDSSDTAVYLYGVTRGLDPAVLGDSPGVAGAPVRGVVTGDLTALVSTVRLDEYGEEALRANLEDLAWIEATARAHHAVVDRAARVAPTAPVRIATVYHDDERVSQVLREGRERFGTALDRITGRSEWGVKAYAYPEDDRPAEEAVPTATGGGSGQAGAGTAYLRRRQEQRRRRTEAGRRLSERAQAIDAELRVHAVAVRRHPPQDPKLSGHAGTPILNVAYLLDDARVPEFQALVRDIDERSPGIGVEMTGPWPPYSFIETDGA